MINLMNPKWIMAMKNKCKYWLFFWFVLFVLLPVQAIGLTDKQIFIWIADELKIEQQYDMPEIQYVTKEKLKDVFRKATKRSYDRWVKEYGKEKADELLDFYLDEAIGLFVPETCELYIGNFLESCKMESIVAHELTHFLQHMEKGPIDSKKYDAENKLLFREMQAGKIEREYMEKFCGKEKN